MKKRVIFTFTVLLIVAFSLPVFAAPWDGAGRRGTPWGGAPWAYQRELTPEQKAEIEQMNQRLFAEQKQMLDRRVEWGYISREDADRRIAFLQERLANDPYRPMFGNRGYGGSWGMGYGPYRELTAEQKAEIEQMNQRFFEERKQMLERRVEWGYISREDADRRIAFLQERLSDDQYRPMARNRGYGRHGGGMRGGGCWGW
jgi:Spy/CpxP family protein refolding chaperone